MTYQRRRQRGAVARPVVAERGVASRREVRGVRGGDFRPREPGRGRRRLVAMFLLGGALLLFVVFVLPPLFGGLLRGMAESNPDLMRLPFVADAVREGMDDRLDRPAGTDDTPVQFTITLGTSARQITDELVQRGLVADRLAFNYILITDGAGSRLRAGTHTLDRTMSPREVAEALQRQPAPTPSRLTVTFRPGLRIEQYTAQLVDERERLGIDPDQFFGLTTEPPAGLRDEFAMLATLPDGHSLEGYLGAGVFEIEPGTDGEGLLRVLLAQRESDIAALVDHALPAPLASFYEAMILASIVEGEATVEAERPLIAGVFLNRLDRAQFPTRLLNADPTVIYGNDTMSLRGLQLSDWNQYVFWAPPGVPMAQVRLDDDLFGFQTYRSRGLPPWPIRSPTVSSLMGVLEPDTDDGYLYFVAKADGTNTHAFARTWEEHLDNIERYVRGGGASPAP